MKKIEPENRRADNDRLIAKTYHSVMDNKGRLRCSCGKELIKMDETTYRCAGGYPIYRFEDGTMIIDKFGNLMIKTEDHNTNNTNNAEENKNENQN